MGCSALCFTDHQTLIRRTTMNIRVLMGCALALAIYAPSANALTIMDKDKTAYTVKVMPKGGKEIDVALKANANTDIDCKAGCQLSLNGKTRAIDGTLTKITIQDGKFVM
jgi:hypothetical protein